MIDSRSIPLEAVFEQALSVEQLELEAVPPGTIGRQRITLAQDGLGRALQVPTLIARGRKPGPIFGLTAAVHGNEVNGIPVIHKLFEQLDPTRLRGSLVAVCVVNIPGYLAHNRLFGHRDLNHVFPGNSDGATHSVFANRLLERIVRRFDALCDLHTASFGRVNSLYVRADMTEPTSARMAYLQRPQIIVHNPPSDRTLRGAAMERGCKAITVEIGNPQTFQRDFIKRALLGVRAVMAEAEMIPARAVSPGPRPVLCERSFWLYTAEGGLLEVYPELGEIVQAEQIVARLFSIYGDLIHEYRSPESGIVVGKSVNPVSPTGARILHLGIIATEHDRRFVFATKPGLRLDRPGAGDPIPSLVDPVPAARARRRKNSKSRIKTKIKHRDKPAKPEKI